MFSPIFVDGEIGLGLSRTIVERLAIEELACSLALGLALTQPNSWCVAVETHRTTLQALSAMMRDEPLSPNLTSAGERLRVALEGVGRDERIALKELVMRAPDLETWRVAIEQTSYRAALLICGDIRLIQLLSQGIGSLSSTSRDECFYKLLLFSVSPHYLTLRRQLQLGWQG